VLKCQGSEKINGKKKVKLTTMGNIIEIMSIDKLNIFGLPVKKISKNEYVVVDTGEIKEYENHAENRSENKDSLRKTFKKIRQLINTNFTGAKNELAFTITYGENMTSSERLYDDFRKFFMRLRYKYPNVDYISVVEPQERGAWHCHVLLRFNDLAKIYIPNDEIAFLWGHGFVSVKAIRKDVDNLGAYLSAYLGDVALTQKTYYQLRPGSVVKEVEIDGKKKKFIKGGRLHLYPPGMNIYRCSRGIKNPTMEYMSYEKAKKIVGAATPNYTQNIKILDDDGIQVNSITYEQYNLKRSKSEDKNTGNYETTKL
jgi:hypothetical protein